MEKRISIFKKTFPISWMDLGFTLAVIAFGAVLMIWPQVASRYLLIAIGILIACVGAFQLLRYFRAKGRARLNSNDFAIGLSWISLGALIIFARAAFGELLAYLFGLVLLVSAAFQVQSALRLRYMKFERWTLALIGVLISLVFGILIILDPALPTWIIGLALAIEGVLYLLSRVFFNRVFDACAEEFRPIINVEE